MKGAQRILIVAHDEATLTEELERDVIPRLRKLADVADDLPRRQEQVFLFQLVEFFVVIDPGRQCVLQAWLGDGPQQRRSRADAIGEPREHTAEIGAALPLRRLAVEIVAVEEDALPLLID